MCERKILFIRQEQLMLKIMLDMYKQFEIPANQSIRQAIQARLNKLQMDLIIELGELQKAS